MADTLKLEIVTPAGVTYSEDVAMVTMPAVDGQIGVFPKHIPLMTRIEPGEIIVLRNGTQDFLAVGALTDMAVAAKDIDAAKAEEARHRAAARLRDKLSDEDVAAVNASLARSLAQLRVKRRHRF